MTPSETDVYRPDNTSELGSEPYTHVFFLSNDQFQNDAATLQQTTIDVSSGPRS